jgi:hypothetical protein
MRRFHFLQRIGFARTARTLLTGVLLFALHTVASADTVNYGLRRQIRACVLVSSACVVNNLPRNHNPHLFYFLERRTDLKPGGWEFLNPLAPTTLTGEIRSRWAARGIDPTLNSPAFQAGGPITKNLGAYWEVNLDKVSATDLQQFDIVYISLAGNVFFTPEQRDKLRRYMDGGGTVWMEEILGTTMGNGLSGQFVVELRYNSAPATPPTIAPFANRHPILNYPYSISYQDVASMDPFSTLRLSHSLLIDTSSGRALVPVLAANGERHLSAADYGAGHLVVSSALLGVFITSMGGGSSPDNSPNTGAVSGENIIAALPTQLKLAYNIISWTSAIPTAGVNTRRTSSNGETLGGSLGRKWSAVPVNSVNPGSGAVMLKGAVFAVDGNNILHCYDANPGQDMDGDRNEDDGIPDYRKGTPYDEIWNVQLQQGFRYSTPVVMSVTGPVPDIVAVTASNGVTYAFNAFPRTGNGRLDQTTTQLWFVTYGPNNGNLSNAQGSAPIPSPAYSEGILFSLVYGEGATTNAPWRIAATNVVNGQNAFGPGARGIAPYPEPLGTSVPGMGQVLGSLTVGYVRDDATGALDKVIYVPTAPINAPGSGAVHAVWFSTKNEPLIRDPSSPNVVRYRPIGNRAQVPWFAPTSAPSDLGMRPVVHIVRRDPNTRLVTGVETRTDITVSYEGAAGSRTTYITIPVTLNEYDTIFADYTLNWSAQGYAGNTPGPPQGQDMFKFSNSRIFTLVTPPDPNPPNNPIAAFPTGHGALSGVDNLIFNANWSGGGQTFADRVSDRIYGLHEQFNTGAAVADQTAGGGSEVAWMYSPHPGGQYQDRQTNATVQLVPRLLNVDTYNNTLAPRQNFATGLKFVGSPAVSKDVAYVVATGMMRSTGANPNFEAVVIMAFRANPKKVISTDMQFPQDNTQVRIEQIDLTRSTSTNAMNPANGGAVFNELPAANYVVDRISGTITINNARTNNGDALDFALPFWVSVGTQQRQILVDKQTGYGPLDNLIWYMVIPRFSNSPNTLPSSISQEIQGRMNGTGSITPASGPSIIGDTLYFGTDEGRVVAVSLTGGSGGAQVPVLTGRGANGGTTRFQVMDAQLTVTGLTPGRTLAQRLIHPPLGTTGLLAIGAPAGATVLERQLTLIADNNRLLEVDFGGNAVWSLDSTKTVGVAGGTIFDTGQITASVMNLARPNMARHYTLNSFVVADTGNNRVLLLDKGGFVTFELRSVLNDMKYLRPGDPITLNTPTDVQTFTRSGTGISIYNRETGVEYTYGGDFFSTHYLIADSGNHRLLEVVYAYRPDGQPVTLTPDNASAMNGYGPVQMLGQVVFVTKTLAEQNAKFRYRTIQQFALPRNFNDPFGLQNVYLVSAIDNQRQSAVDPMSVALGQFGTNESASGGSLVILKRDFTSGTDNADGDVERVMNSIAYTASPADPTNNTIIRRQTINNPTWFKEFEITRNNERQVRYMLTDENGCYVLRPGATDLIVEWALSADDYYFLTGRRLRAVSMQRLSQSDYHQPTNEFYPHYLITNRYSGEDNVPELFNSVGITLRGRVTGEVFEVRGIDYFEGFNNGQSGYRRQDVRHYVRGGDGALDANPTSAIVWMFPNETLPGRNVNGPIQGPIRRSIGTADGGTATYLLEQPTFAERPY